MDTHIPKHFNCILNVSCVSTCVCVFACCMNEREVVERQKQGVRGDSLGKHFGSA